MHYAGKNSYFLVRVGFSVYYLGRWWSVVDSPKQGVWVLERKRRHNIGLPHRTTITTSAIEDVRIYRNYCPVLAQYLYSEQKLSVPETTAFKNRAKQLNACRKYIKVVQRLLARAQRRLEKYEAVCFGDITVRVK